MRHSILIAGLMLLCCAVPALGDETFGQSVGPFLKKYCLACHGPDKAEAAFRVDQLSMQLAQGQDAEQWEEVLNRLQRGEMPPEKSAQPAETELTKVTNLISADFRRFLAEQKSTGGEVALRRLNRAEYNATMSDLLGIEFHAADFFPEDSDEDGFDNIGQALHTSPVLMRAYLHAADEALDQALWFAPKPDRIQKRYDSKENFGYGRPGSNFGLHEGHLVIQSFWSQQGVSGRSLEIKTAGKYRLRIKANAVRSPEETLKLDVMVGGLRQDTIRHVGLHYLPNEQPHWIEEVVSMQPGDGVTFQWYNGKRTAARIAEARRQGRPYDGPGVVIESVEVDGPLFLDEGWPKRSHRLALGSKDPQELTAGDVPQLMQAFADRAFRRQATAEEVKPIVDLVLAELDAGARLPEALRTGLKAVLCSPKFLFLYETDEPLDDYMIASRLSYFLWSSMPDEPLLQLAAAGRLRDPQVLREQTLRMLQDPKVRRLIENFVGQWLDLRKLGEMQPDRSIYPRYTQELENALPEETYLFFAELLAKNLPADQLLDSDFLMLNEVLAHHYGIEGVEGTHFRRVPTPAGSHRGGLLAHASVLNVTSNGTVTSPVVRGAWVLERILGVTPPPPPPDVPVVVPDIRGATTIREQLARHRSVQACNGCHRKIDPLGFALENFDVIGQWRTHYRVRKGPVEGNGWYGDGPAVEAADRLETGEEFAGFEDLRAILLSRREEFHRCLTRKLLTYALGRRLEWGDRPTVEKLASRMVQPDQGLRDLVVAIVLSEPFTSR